MTHIAIDITHNDIIELAKDKAGYLGLTKGEIDKWEYSDAMPLLDGTPLTGELSAQLYLELVEE